MRKNECGKLRWGFLHVFIFIFLIGLQSQELTFSEKEGLLTKAKKNEILGERHFYSNRDSALFFYKKANELYWNIQAWDQYVGCLNPEIALYFYGNQFASLDSAMQIAEKIAYSHLSRDTSRAFTGFLSNSGVINDMIGKYKEATHYYREAIQLYGLRKDTSNLCIVYSNFADMYLTLGDAEEAQRYFFKSLQLQEGFSESNPIIAKRYCDYGKSLYEAGNYDEALIYYEKGLALYEQSDYNKRQYYQHAHQYLLQGLAKIWLEKGDLTKAKNYVDRAIRLIDIADITIDKYVSFELLGRIESEQGNFVQSFNAFQKALEISKELFKEYDKHPDVSTGYLNLGKNAMNVKDYKMAVDYFHQGLLNLSLETNPVQYLKNPSADSYLLNISGVELLKHKGESLYFLYQENSGLDYLKAAYETLANAAELIQLTRNDYYSQSAKVKFTSTVVPVFEMGISLAYELFEKTGDNNYLNDAFLLVEQNRSVVFLESMMAQEALGFSEIPAGLIKNESQLKSEINLLQQKIAIENQKKEDERNINQLKVWDDKLFERTEQYKTLQAYLDRNYPRYNKLKKQFQFANIERVKEKIGNGETAIFEYFVGQKFVYLFYISKADFQVFKLSPTELILNNLENILEEIHQPPNGNKNDFAKFLAASNSLYRQLFVTGKLKIPSAINRLIIIPDDQLSLLPFELLVNDVKVEIPYLINDYAISYSYSSTLLIKNSLKGNNKSKKGLIAFAPSFNEIASSDQRNCSGEKLFSLRCSHHEVDQINKYISGDVFKGNAASKDIFINQSANYNIIHLATHACLENDHPMLNRIWFSGGYVSNYELFNLQLNAELAVLSACNTGSGKILKGEGVQSLARGFLHAGCRSLITSLWSVDDCATSEIMTGTYQELDNGKEKDEALRLAKLKYLSNANKLQKHPYYWGAFVQVGEVKSLEYGLDKRWVLFIVVSSFIIMLVFVLKKKYFS